MKGLHVRTFVPTFVVAKANAPLGVAYVLQVSLESIAQSRPVAVVMVIVQFQVHAFVIQVG
jgi:hypothetical protein